MGKRDTRVDAYIEKSQDFAKPILNYIREIVHKGCPEAEETIKWGFPHFDYKGMMCSMAAFKHHCAFSFWKGSIMKDPEKILDVERENAMGHFGRITSRMNLPKSKIFVHYVKEAAKLNDDGIKLPAKMKSIVAKDLVIPDYFMNKLKKNKKASAAFNDFSYSHKKEYLAWITEAKTDTTKEKRILKTIELLEEGKSLNWKYEKK